MEGVDAIEHVASPVTLSADDPDTLIIPAVNGTLNVLKSALTHGSLVRRIVITSSVAAIMTQTTESRVYTESDWNDAAVKEVEEKGRNAFPPSKYRASKTLAERAAWDFYEKNKNVIPWDLVVLNPPYIFGPILHEVSSPKALNESTRFWWDNVIGGALDNKTLVTNG